MNIEGLDYNTQREKLTLPEYGREVQKMVDYAVKQPTKAQRQRCAETIISVMKRMFPQSHESLDYERKLWDHLAIMSAFKLDIDYPYDVSTAHSIAIKPQPMDYPMSKIPVRHYGKMVFELFERLKTMPKGAEYNELVRITANQMKRNLMQWSHGTCDNEKIASDLAEFTNGRVQLDLSTFHFEKISDKEPSTSRNKRKK